MEFDRTSRNRWRLVTLAFVFGFVFGFLDMQLTAIWTRASLAIPGGIVAGAVCGGLWVLIVPFLLRLRRWQAALVGAAFPFVACLLSIVGVGFLPYVIVGWFIFVPTGILLGLVTHQALSEP
jgi:hypothetical protein